MPDTVAALRRAAAGVPPSVLDEDIDRYIADMLVAEGQKREEAYREVGTDAYRTREPQNIRPVHCAGSSRTNTRFLAAVLRNADSHNARISHSKSYKPCMHGVRGACVRCERHERRRARRRGESPPR